jgi:hypothetical protein
MHPTTSFAGKKCKSHVTKPWSFVTKIKKFAICPKPFNFLQSEQKNVAELADLAQLAELNDKTSPVP